MTRVKASCPRNKDFMLGLAMVLAAFSFGVACASHQITDADLWAKLALGAHVWKFGAPPHHDLFAFTPVLPEYVDHEWGAGAVFYSLLKLFGPTSLMWLKMGLCFGAIFASGLTGRRAGCSWPVLLLLAIPASACIQLGYVPVIRSHTFTYFFFAVTLLCLEEMRRGNDQKREAFTSFWVRNWPATVVIAVMLLWVNVHGGFVAGLGTIAIYSGFAVLECYRANLSPSHCHRLERGGNDLHNFGSGVAPMKCADVPNSSSGGEGRGEEALAVPGSSVGFWRRAFDEKRDCNTQGITRRHVKTMLLVTLCSLAVTFINPYGFKFWSYLLPAVLAKRSLIAEWQPLSLFAADIFMPFRILFFLVLFFLLAGWKGTGRKSLPGLLMLIITACLAWRSRRHAPFFGVASLCFVGPYLATTLARLSSLLPHALFTRVSPSTALVVIYGLVALFVATYRLPHASMQPLSPVGHDPVREADILQRAHVLGNLATPFHWGSYLAWRLFPEVRISMDGRYEAAYPESTFQLNNALFGKSGAHWDNLLRKYPVDFIILDLVQERLRPEDLQDRGYVLIWVTRGSSALLTLEKHAARLREVASQLPPTTVNPLDASIPDGWWSQ
jgi:hypothetical protein